MLGVGWLKARDMLAKLGLIQPLGQLAAQAAFAFGSVEVVFSMQGMATKGRGPFAGNHQDKAEALAAAMGNEIQEAEAGHFQSHPMQINAGFNFGFAAEKFYLGSSVETGKLRRGMTGGKFGCCDFLRRERQWGL